MTKILSFILILLLSGCTIIPGEKELKETIKAIRENYHRYKNHEAKWHFVVFMRCDFKDGKQITCKKDRMNFVIFKREKNLI